MRVSWTRRAVGDLIEIGRYIAADDRSAARRYIARLKERVDQAAKAPGSGRQVPEFARDDVREVIEGSYRIVYQTDAHVLRVLTVFEGHRTLRLGPGEVFQRRTQ